MKTKIEKIFIIIILLLSIYNIYNVYSCYKWTNDTKYWDGGLGAAEFYIGFGMLVILLQIVNIILSIKILLKDNNKKFKSISLGIIIVLFIITFFIPIYGYSILYPYMNLYGISIIR